MKKNLPTFVPHFDAKATLPYSAEINGLSDAESEILKNAGALLAGEEFTKTDQGLIAHFATREELQAFHQAVGYGKQEGDVLPVPRFQNSNTILNQIGSVDKRTLEPKESRVDISPDGKFTIHNLNKGELDMVHSVYTSLFPSRPCGEADEMENGKYFFPSQMKFSGELHDAHEGLSLLNALERQHLRFANKQTLLSAINRRFQPTFETSAWQQGEKSGINIKIEGLSEWQLFDAQIALEHRFKDAELTLGKDAIQLTLPSGKEALELFNYLQKPNDITVHQAIAFRAPNVTRQLIAEHEKLRTQSRGEIVIG